MNDTVAGSPSSINRRTVAGGASAFAIALALRNRIGLAGAAAQDSTPTPNPDGVAGEVLGAAIPPSVPEMELAIRRTIIAPGGGLPPHSHPGAIMFAIDAGTFGYTPLEGTIQVMRATDDGTPAAVEVPPLGVELIFTKGDAFFAEASRDEMRNAGEDDVVLLMAALTPVGQEFQPD